MFPKKFLLFFLQSYLGDQAEDKDVDKSLYITSDRIIELRNYNTRKHSVLQKTMLPGQQEHLMTWHFPIGQPTGHTRRLNQ